jgi:hypothetical protein
MAGSKGCKKGTKPRRMEFRVHELTIEEVDKTLSRDIGSRDALYWVIGVYPREAQNGKVGLVYKAGRPDSEWGKFAK